MKTERQGWAVRAVGRTWQGVMALILGILLFCQGWEYYAKAALPWPNWLCLLAGAGGMALMAGAARLILRRTRSPKKRLLCVAGVSAVMAGAIFYCSAHYAVTPSWDPAYVYFDAGNLSGIFGESLSNDYYSRYPNNLLITLVFSLVFRVADSLRLWGEEYFLIHGLQCAGFGLTLFLVYDCADLLLDRKRPAVSLWCWGAAALLIGISPWVVVQYTDTAALILGTLELRLFLQIRKGRRRAFLTGLFFLLGALAFRVKPQTLILPIAAVAMRLLGEGRELFRRENLRRTGAVLCAAVLGAGLGQGIYQLAYARSGYELDPEARFGVSHYLKMGLNETEMGGYSEEDVASSGTAATRKERDEKNREIILERIRKMGPGGLLRLAVRKTLTNYGDGTFAWEQEAGYGFYGFATQYFKAGSQWGFDHIPPLYIGPEYDYMVEVSYSHIWRTLCQCVWLAALGLSLFSFHRGTGQEIAVLQLALLGLTLFELLFEARARYLFGYAPVYILLAGIGLARIRDLIGSRKRRGTEEKKDAIPERI